MTFYDVALVSPISPKPTVRNMCCEMQSFPFEMKSAKIDKTDKCSICQWRGTFIAVDVAVVITVFAVAAV